VRGILQTPDLSVSLLAIEDILVIGDILDKETSVAIH
jgi:hypothetical protein